MAWAKSSKVSNLYPETLTQIAIVKWFNLQYPQLKGHLIKIGNGGKKSTQGHILSGRMGEVVGASDLFLAYPSCGFAGLWLEVKPEKFKANKSNSAHINQQLDFIESMREVGYDGEMVVGSKEGIEVIKSYMSI
jgi:hypothetical protein